MDKKRRKGKAEEPGKPGRPAHVRPMVRWTPETLTEAAVRKEMVRLSFNLAGFDHVMQVMRRHIDALKQFNVKLRVDEPEENWDLFNDNGLVAECYADYLDWVEKGESVLTMKLPEYVGPFVKFLQYESPADIWLK